MRILAIISGEYGIRHANNIEKHKPEGWSIETWRAPAAFPLIIDYPEEFLPASFEPCDLILSFAENKSVAELIPEIAKMTGAKGVIVAVDNAAWLPRGLGRQLIGWLERMDVGCATPKPLCSLTEKDYKITRRDRQPYDCEIISEFARYFGQPDIRLTIDEETNTIASANVRVDAVCGCARPILASCHSAPVTSPFSLVCRLMNRWSWRTHSGSSTSLSSSNTRCDGMVPARATATVTARQRRSMARPR